MSENVKPAVTVNLNLVAGLAFILVAAWIAKDFVRPNPAPGPAPSPVANLAALVADAGDRQYIARLYGQLGQYVAAESRITDHQQLLETVTNSVGTWGAMAQGWRIAERYPACNDEIKRRFAAFAKSEPLTNEARAEFARVCEGIARELSP